MRASAGWKWKAGDCPPQTGCSTCKSSLQEAISVRRHLPTTKFGGMWSVLLLEVFYTPGVDSLCRQVQRQLQRNELARFYHHRARKCLPPRKLHREIQ